MRPVGHAHSNRVRMGGFTWRIPLTPPATPSANYLLTIRSRKQRFRRTRTSDTVRWQEAPTAMGHTDEYVQGPTKGPWNQGPGACATSTHVICIKNRNGPIQESRNEGSWTNPGMGNSYRDRRSLFQKFLNFFSIV